MRGQTIGKRLLGVRVVRLDGQPITWWSACERSGGYVAGLATGFLVAVASQPSGRMEP